ncbi:MAG: WG repeat-containing protein [Xenococcaceae cyanobacterium]
MFLSLVSITTTISLIKNKPSFAQTGDRSTNIKSSLSNNKLAQIVITQPGIYGFVDRTGKMIIPPQFDIATDFIEGLALVQNDCGWGFIDRTGKIVISPQFDKISGIIHKLIVVKVNEKYGFVNSTNMGIVKPQFDNVYGYKTASSFSDWAEFTTKEVYRQLDIASNLFKDSNKLIKVNINGKRSFVDGDGKIVIQPKFERVIFLNEKTALAKINDKFSFIDRTGNILDRSQLNTISDSYEGLAIAIDSWGRLITLKKPLITRFLDNNLLRSEFSLEYFYNNNLANSYSDLNEILPSNFREMLVFSNGRGLIEFDGKYGYINTQGKIVIPLKFEQATPFYKELAGVKVKNKWGFIDRTGKIVIQPQFDEVYPFSDGLARVRVGDTSKYTDKLGWNFKQLECFEKFRQNQNEQKVSIQLRK